MNNNKLHIGELIRAKLDENGQKVSWLAEKVFCSRSNFYRILEKDEINLNLLWRISCVLHFDFFACISDKFKADEAEQKQQ
ncbi:MAG: XRE family transcriptional regulator [Prevotellaceae bacterium]|jgi:hypothetical protein|nr:XRE family transcriptional regulator [Prevotellaceae bacterium]